MKTGARKLSGIWDIWAYREVGLLLKLTAAQIA